jgi:hypothetical protein
MADIDIYESGEIFSDEEGTQGVSDPLGDSQHRVEGLLDPSSTAGASSSTEQYDVAKFLEDVGEPSINVVKDGNDFIENLTLEIQDSQGPPLQENVTKLINSHLSRDFGKAYGNQSSSIDDRSQGGVVINKIKSYMIPSNLQQLKSCKTNDCVFKALTPSIKRESGDLLIVEAANCKAITAQGRAMSKLVDLKKELPNDFSEKVNEIFKLMADSIEFNSFSRARVNNFRRDRILANLNSNYNHLKASTKAEHGLLFGENIATAIKDVEVTNRLANKLSNNSASNNRHFLARGGRGRGRVRRYPYQPRGQNSYQPQFQQSQQPKKLHR